MNAKPKEASVVRGNYVVSRQGAAVTVKGVQLTSIGTGILTSTVVRGIGSADERFPAAESKQDAAKR
jgi:hypothetical protein